jgi:hypothetical protein
MASTTNGAVKVEGQGEVVKVETKHYVKLMADGARTVNLPIADRSNVPAIDAIYRRYQIFTRVIVTVKYGDSVEVLKSNPLDASEVFENKAALQSA